MWKAGLTSFCVFGSFISIIACKASHKHLSKWIYSWLLGKSPDLKFRISFIKFGSMIATRGIVPYQITNDFSAWFSNKAHGIIYMLNQPRIYQYICSILWASYWALTTFTCLGLLFFYLGFNSPSRQGFCLSDSLKKQRKKLHQFSVCFFNSNIHFHLL